MLSLLIVYGVLLKAFSQELLTEKREFRLESYTTTRGEIISPLRIGYETYGELNQEKTNAILITHYFSGNSHAAGKYSASDKSVGYWDGIIGPGKVLDTNKYFIIASDCLVNISPNSSGVITTGPASLNPKTKRPYGVSFPLVALEDFVNVQKSLVDSFGIQKLVMVAGASGGGAQAMQWAASFPQSVDKVLNVIGPGLSMPDYVVAMLNLWSMPIKLDADWREGQYYGKKLPLKGVAESLKMITFSALSFDWGDSFQRGLEGESSLSHLNSRYKVEAFLEERAKERASHVDANSLLYTAKAIQTFDVEKKVKEVQAKILFIPVETDLIFPPFLSERASKRLCDQKKKSAVYTLKTKGGHLDGLSKIGEASATIRSFLEDKLKFCP